MDKDLDLLVSKRDRLLKEQQIHNLRGTSLSKQIEVAVAALQDNCPHLDVVETSDYHSGGYDYCAETFYTDTCNTCGKVLRQWSKSHHGIYS